MLDIDAWGPNRSGPPQLNECHQWSSGMGEKSSKYIDLIYGARRGFWLGQRRSQASTLNLNESVTAGGIQ